MPDVSRCDRRCGWATCGERRLRELLAGRDTQVAELRALVADLQAQVAELAARAGCSCRGLVS